MPNMRLLAAQQKLANAEKMGDPDRVKRIKARISELKKEEKAALAAEEPAEPKKSAKEKG
jgi:hypothetical protein